VIEHIAQTLEDHKAVDIVCMNVANLSPLFEHIVVATATSSRHMQTLGEQVALTSKRHSKNIPQLEGNMHSDWLLVDAGSVIIHIMTQAARDHYELEKLWSIEEETS